MSVIDRQRTAAVKLLEGLGYTLSGGGRQAPAAVETLAAEAGAPFALLADQAGELIGYVEGSAERCGPRAHLARAGAVRGQSSAGREGPRRQGLGGCPLGLQAWRRGPCLSNSHAMHRTAVKAICLEAHCRQTRR